MNNDPSVKVDARLALVRHGVMAAEFESGRWRMKVVKTPLSGYKPPVVSEEVRREYAFELLEVAGRFMDEGFEQDRADALARDLLGCVEFWDYQQRTDGRCGEAVEDEAVEVRRAA